MKSKIVWMVILAIILCFIWGNSLLSKETSAALSDAVSELLSSFFGEEDTNEAESVGAGLLRKIAHFVEFCALGAVSAILARSFFSQKHIVALVLALEGVSVALLDETIQIFSGRGPAVRDIWIDMGGFAFGCALVIIVTAIIAQIKANDVNKLKKQT